MEEEEDEYKREEINRIRGSFFRSYKKKKRDTQLGMY